MTVELEDPNEVVEGEIDALEDGVWEVVGTVGGETGGGPPREGRMEMFFLRNAI